MSLERRGRLILETTLHHDASGRYGVQRRLFLRKLVGESMGHVAMKWLSWLLYYEEGLEIEVSAGQHFKPDLLSTHADGRPRTWIDCGSTSLRKLVEIERRNRDAHIVIVKPHRRVLGRYAAQARERLPAECAVTFLAFDDGFVDELAERLVTRHHATATVPAGRQAVYLELDGEALHTAVHRA